jgi:DnaJ-class molecular chaperone
MAKKAKVTILEEASFWKFANWGFDPTPQWVPDGVIYENEGGHKMASEKGGYEALAVPVAYIAKSHEEALVLFQQRKAAIREILEAEIAKVEGATFSTDCLKQQDICPRCNGHGGDPEDYRVVAHVLEQAPCRLCDGNGWIEE